MLSSALMVPLSIPAGNISYGVELGMMFSLSVHYMHYLRLEFVASCT